MKQKQPITLEFMISELGEIPYCQCDTNNGQGCGQKVNIYLGYHNYLNYKKKGYPKFIRNHDKIGKPKSKEHKLKLRKPRPFMCNENNPMFRPEVRAKQLESTNTQEFKDNRSIRMSGEKHPLYGKKHKPESIEKMKQSHLGKIPSQSTRDLWSLQRKGVPKSDEHNRKNSEAQSGDKHWGYGKPSPKLHMFSALDHLCKDKYCILFNNKLKEQVRIRDSHICQLCGKTQQKESKKLAVHHIHYDKPNCYPDLVCLCNSCNAKVNKLIERKKCESLFMNKLNDRELLFWTKRR